MIMVLLTVLDTFKDIVSVIFSIALILFITGFCIFDLIHAKHQQDKARRDKEKHRYDK